MGVKVTNPTTTPTYSQTGNNAPFKAYARSNYVSTTSTLADMGKVYLQFDLSSTWDTYGQANLASATLTLWGENGPTRSFTVSGLNDNAGLEAWTGSTLSWLNAPGNVTTDNSFDPTLTTPVWPSGTVGVNTYNASLGTDFDQSARYVSPDIKSFLATDTDGKVTFMLNGNGNQNWWVGTAGAYATDLANGLVSTNTVSLGEVTRNSPTLTLTFTPVPEPATLSLIALGLGGLLLRRRR
jgi:hypothetical protein